MIEIKMSCSNCVYFEIRFKDTNQYGWCCRYPERIDVDSDYWCGEFKEEK